MAKHRKQPDPEPGKAAPLDPRGGNKARPVKRKLFPLQTDKRADPRK